MQLFNTLARRSILWAGAAVGAVAVASPFLEAVSESSETIDATPPTSDQEPGGLVYITSVSVEANGWVLSIEGIWPPCTFADFQLEPDYLPRIALDVRAFGYEPRSNWAARTERVRKIVGTKPLRVSLAGPPVDLVSLDEREAGSASRRVRVALSEPIHRLDTVVSVTFGVNWRNGAREQTIYHVRNASEADVEVPSMRWATPTQMRVTPGADRRIDLLVASAFAEGRNAVAGVRFIATDGQRTNFVWQVGPSTSNDYGDKLRCWGVAAIESGLVDGLSGGLVTIHAEVYPFIGEGRGTGTSHQPNAAMGYGYSVEVPLHIAWDPDGSRYPERHVYVDPINGVQVPEMVTVGTTVAAAKAGTRAISLSVAMRAIYLNNLNLPASNGRPFRSRAGDNAVLTLAPGVHTGFGGVQVPSDAMSHDCRMIVQGDPGSSAPKMACILRTAEALYRTRYNLFLYRNFKLEMTGYQISEKNGYYHLDDMLVEAQPGLETLQTSPFSAPPLGEIRNSATRTRWWRSGGGFAGSNSRWRLLRACEFSRPAAAPTLIGCRTIMDPTVAPFTSSVILALTLAGQPGLAADQIWWGNMIRGIQGRGFAFPDEGGIVSRFRLVNNLFERGGSTDAQPIASLGEGTFTSARNCLIEGNTFVGQRFNWGYNDPPSNDVTFQNTHVGNVIRNNYFDRTATKHDDFFSPRFRATRPGFIAGWEILYGVGYEANVYCNRFENSDDFKYEYYGLNSLLNQNAGPDQGNEWTCFLDDRSRLGGMSSPSGYGTYQPTAYSPFVRHSKRACIDVDATGRARAEIFSAGALEAVAA